MASGLRFLAVLAVASIIAVGAKAADWDAPDFYHSRDGPRFDVSKTKEPDVQQRRVEAGKWVAVNVSGVTYDEAYSAGTKLLDGYWNGENQQEAHLDQTAPRAFMLLYPTGQGRALASTWTVEYFLPHKLHGAPPVPTGQGVQVIDVQEAIVWVKAFGGYAREADVVKTAFDFLGELKKDGVHTHDDVLGLALYDDPTRLINRHNEIWVWEKQAAPSLSNLLARLEAWVRERHQPATVTA